LRRRGGDIMEADAALQEWWFEPVEAADL